MEMINGSPQVYNRGTLDLSGRKTTPTPVPLSSHVAKQYIYAVKGKAAPQLMKGADRVAFYGANTFDDKSAYFNHSTYFANIQDGVDANCMYQRIIPSDATEANFTLWLDVADTYIDDYERVTDSSSSRYGKIKTDVNNIPSVIGKPIKGYKVQFRVTSVKGSTAPTLPTAVNANAIKKGKIYQIESLSNSNSSPADYSSIGSADSVNGTRFTAARDGNLSYGRGTVLELLDYTSLKPSKKYAFLNTTDVTSAAKDVDLSELGFGAMLKSNTDVITTLPSYVKPTVVPVKFSNIKFYEIVDFTVAVPATVAVLATDTAPATVAVPATVGAPATETGYLGLISAPTLMPEAGTISAFEEIAGALTAPNSYKALTAPVKGVVLLNVVRAVKATSTKPLAAGYLVAPLTEIKDIKIAREYLILDDSATIKITDYAMLAGANSTNTEPARGTITNAVKATSTLLNRVNTGFKAKWNGTDSNVTKYVTDGKVKECTEINHLVAGCSYLITYIGDSVFTDVGASDNKVGVVFTATGAGQVGKDAGGALLLGTSIDTSNTGEDYLSTAAGETKYLRSGTQVSIDGHIDIVDEKGKIALGKKSKMYPIMEFIASSHGEWANNVGVRLFSDIAAVFEKDILQGKTFTYSFGIVHRESKYKSGKLIENRNLEQKFQFSFNPDAISSLSSASLYFNDLYLKRYQNLDHAYGDLTYADFDQVHIYDENVSGLLSKFAKREYDFIADTTNSAPSIQLEMAMMDFNNDIVDGLTTDIIDGVADGLLAERHAFNFIGANRYDEAPYHTYIFEDAKEVPLLSTTTLWTEAGSDGTMNLPKFDELVANELEKYGDPSNELQDIAYHVESIFYDSGFSMKTKQSIIKFISNRRDTCVALSSYASVEESRGVRTVSGIDQISDSDMNWAIYLKAALQSTKESDYFGTPCARGVMLAGSGIPKAGRYKARTPITAELAIKAARYMGQPKWVNAYRFDEGDYKKFELLDSVNLYWVPPKTRNIKWAMGINYALRYDRESLFFPCVKTIYEDDTSVLNSFITVMAICHLNKVDNKIWREFTGTSGMSDAVLKDKVNASVKAQTQGVFDNRFVINPKCQITAADNERGYSWTLPVEIYAYNMKTAMTTWIESYRMSDLGA